MKFDIKNIALIIISIGLCFASSCKPDNKVQKYMGKFPLKEQKAYLYFKPGSMWVYQCDSTGELDTQIMISVDTPWFTKTYIDYQLLMFNRKSISEGSIYTTFDPTTDVPYSEHFNWFSSIIISRSNPKNGGSGTDAVFYEPFDSSRYASASSPTYYKGLLTNYTVLGKTYDTVRVFKVQATSGFPIVNSWRKGNLDLLSSIQYYWAKNVGLVQLKVFAWDRIRNEPFTHNWNLKDFKLK